MKIDEKLRNKIRKKIIKELKSPKERHITIKTAIAMTSNDIDTLTQALPELQGATIRNEIDNEIIGGLVIVDGSKIVDMSIKGRLQDLTTQLL